MKKSCKTLLDKVLQRWKIHLIWCCTKFHQVKILQSAGISGFGGMNFVADFFDKNGIGCLFNKLLPALPSQSKFSWRDVFYGLCAVYLCGGDCLEDLNHHIKGHFKNNPKLNLPSADTLLRRMSQLAVMPDQTKTPRGLVEHSYCVNALLEDLMIRLLNKTDIQQQDELVLDYDNTILFCEKSDSKMSYKRAPGYQPGVATLNREFIVYLENRNGNSDAKSFQPETLKRLFDAWERNYDKTIDVFRADAASYQYEVIRLVESKVKRFYIGCRNSYVDKYYDQISDWKETHDRDGVPYEVGCMRIKPFTKRSKAADVTEYRLVVKRRKNKSGQVNLITQDAYEYRSIITNDFDKSAIEIVHFYNQRGGMEKIFDVLKNDFGWKNMPFSTLNKNHVFLIFTAIVSNLYRTLIKHFSAKAKWLSPTFRLKKFIFRFMTLPANWVRRGRKLHLRIFTEKAYPT